MLPEMRLLITRGWIFILIGSILLTDEHGYLGFDYILYGSIALILYGANFVLFPAVRMVHELYGDTMSPKTRWVGGGHIDYLIT